MLKFNFSAVDPHHQRLEKSFLNNIRVNATAFLIKYADYLDSQQRTMLLEKLDQMDSAADIVLNVTKLCNMAKQKIYIIIC